MLFEVAQWLGILFGTAFLVWVTRPGTPVRRKRHPWFDRARVPGHGKASAGAVLPPASPGAAPGLPASNPVEPD